MAKRPVFTSAEGTPFYKIVDCEFEWFAGFSKAQKQRSITALHSAFTSKYPDLKVLEISSKSMQEHGENLSAFFLKNNDNFITTFHTESGKTFWKMLNGENIKVINPK